MRAPTSRQLEVLRLLRDLTAARGYAPTLSELRDGLRVSSVYTVVGHVDALDRRGLVERDERVARSLRLTAAGRAVLRG